MASHSSGIPVSEGLKQAFGSALGNTTVRFFKCVIENEEVVVKETVNAKGTWEEDFETVVNYLDKDSACYILFRTDSQGATGYNWLFFCYVPDKSKVKDKMLYASTRATVKITLGAGYFTDDVFGTVPADFSKKGYDHHVTSKKMDAPLTEQEQLKSREHGEIHAGVSSTYVHGVAFPVLPQVTDAISKLLNGSLNYVQVAIDVDNEKIILDHTATISSFSEFPSHVPTDVPRFHFYAYKHEFDGAEQVSNVYIFSCPDGSKGTKSAPVKQRMLYSSSKANVSNILTSVPATIHAKFEINAGDDVNEDQLFETLHPKQEEKAKGFSKPSRPGKGGARLVKKN